MMSRGEAEAMWDKARDVLNAQAEQADECVGCGYLHMLDDDNPDCEECGFDPTLHDDGCEILAQANRDAAYWNEAQARGCECQCSAREEARAGMTP